MLDKAEREKGRTWIKGVEIFEVGKHNGLLYTKDDLRDMAAAYHETKELVDPVFVTNHDDSINYGFVENIRANAEPYTDWRGKKVEAGQRLIADILIDDWLADAFKDSKYRRISSELYPNYKHPDTGKKYAWVIRAVSGQGGTNLEAITTLKPLAMSARESAQAKKFNALYFQAVPEGTAIQIIKFQDGDIPKMDEEVKKALADILAAVQSQGARIDAIEAKVSSEKPKEAEGPKDPEEMKDKEATADGKVEEKKAEEMEAKKFNDRLVALERENALLRKFNEHRDRMDTLRPKIAKFCDANNPKNMKFVPAKLEEVLALAATLEAKSPVVKFADSMGKQQAQSQQDAFLGLLESLAPIGGLLENVPTHRERSNVTGAGSIDSINVQLFGDAKVRAKEKGISEFSAYLQLLDDIEPTLSETDKRKLYGLSPA